MIANLVERRNFDQKQERQINSCGMERVKAGEEYALVNKKER